jgi:putative transposase
MARFLVVPGSVAVASDRLVQILGVNADGSIEARDLANGSTFNCDPSSLRAAPRARHEAAGAAQRIDVAGDNDWETARQREAVLKTISEQGYLSRQVADAAANLGVSARTVFRWLAAYRQMPQTSSLLPNPMGPPKGTKRIDAKVEEVIEAVINDVYLTKPRAKKEEVTRMVSLRCEALGLKAPSRKPILARLSALDKALVAKARLEPGEAAALVDFVPGSYKVDRPLDVVQIDHTLADVIVVDEENRLPIGRPWLTLAVDVATRVIVGFYVSLEATSSTSVALCIAQAVLPKEHWLRQRELNCSWPVWGLPKAVHADNGADFTAAALRRGCDEHGIKLIFRPIANPHYGGHIERLIGTIMGRVHLLPGSTGSNPQDKGHYPAQAQARLTMAELEQGWHWRSASNTIGASIKESENLLWLPGSRGSMGKTPSCAPYQSSRSNSQSASFPSRKEGCAGMAFTCFTSAIGTTFCRYWSSRASRFLFDLIPVTCPGFG